MVLMQKSLHSILLFIEHLLDPENSEDCDITPEPRSLYSLCKITGKENTTV